MGAYGVMGSEAIGGIGQMLGQAKGAMGEGGGGFGGLLGMGKGDKPLSNDEVAHKQAGAEKSYKKMGEAMAAADAAGKPGPSYMSMANLMALGQNAMDDPQKRAMALQNNSRAQMYQKGLLSDYFGGGR